MKLAAIPVFTFLHSFIEIMNFFAVIQNTKGLVLGVAIIIYIVEEQIDKADHIQTKLVIIDG